MTRAYLLLILFIVFAASAIAQVRDYSDKGADFAILKDIRLGASTVVPDGFREVSVEGQVITASAFKVVTKEEVPFLDGSNPYNNVIKHIDVHYELLVGHDTNNIVHDKLIEVLREIAELPGQKQDFSSVGLNGEDGRYLIFSGQPRMPKYVWFDGRIVTVRFVTLGERRRDRGPSTETFWKEKIRFYPDGQKLTLAEVPKSFGSDFLRRLSAGDLKRSGN